ncbi:putative protein TPRXL [Penaeus monodon]|uniref:putative protein TPRXL n=1 Tax=Penaeus monodon TaxID=6687 RepID=UPI0018A6E9A0|nr:putative protein TPRXL [Penaeus monodon]
MRRWALTSATNMPCDDRLRIPHPLFSGHNSLSDEGGVAILDPPRLANTNTCHNSELIGHSPLVYKSYGALVVDNVQGTTNQIRVSTVAVEFSPYSQNADRSSFLAPFQVSLNTSVSVRHTTGALIQAVPSSNHYQPSTATATTSSPQSPSSQPTHDPNGGRSPARHPTGTSP